MRAGKRDRQIVIESQAQTTDAAGQPLRAWSVVGRPWAEVIAQPGSDTFEGDQTSPRRSVSFRIVYRPGVTSAMQVVFDGERYEIEDVVEEGRRVSLLLKCSSTAVTTGGPLANGGV